MEDVVQSKSAPFHSTHKAFSHILSYFILSILTLHSHTTHLELTGPYNMALISHQLESTLIPLSLSYEVFSLGFYNSLQTD
jgi:hypothetical protein